MLLFLCISYPPHQSPIIKADALLRVQGWEFEKGTSIGLKALGFRVHKGLAHGSRKGFFQGSTRVH